MIKETKQKTNVEYISLPRGDLLVRLLPPVADLSKQSIDCKMSVIEGAQEKIAITANERGSRPYCRTTSANVVYIMLRVDCVLAIMKPKKAPDLEKLKFPTLGYAGERLHCILLISCLFST